MLQNRQIRHLQTYTTFSCHLSGYCNLWSDPSLGQESCRLEISSTILFCKTLLSFFTCFPSLLLGFLSSSFYIFFLISLNVADAAVLLESGTKKHVTFLALHFFYSFCTTQTDGTDSKVTTLGFPQMNLEDAIQAQHEEKERSLPVGTLNFSLNSLELTGTGCYV